MNMRPAQQGFSFLELIITLTVLAIAAGIALPSAKHFWQRYELHSAVSQLQQELRTAQSHAILYQQTVGLCPSVTGRVCGGTWQQGRLEFRVGKQGIQSEQAYPALARSVTVTYQGFPLGRNYILYNSNGLTESSNGSFTIAQLPNQTHYRLVLNKAGRLRVE